MLSGGTIPNPLITMFGIKIDNYYKLITTNKPIDTSLSELGFSLTGSTTPLKITFTESSLIEKLFVDQIVPLLFFLLLLVVFMRLMGGKG